MNKTFRIVFCLLLLVFLSGSSYARTVSLSSLLDEMVDRDAMTRYPDPEFRTLQASSYDRTSKSPDENWFANNDTAQFMREETNGARQEWVLMDAEGPGAIVRFWLTAPHYKSILRIYLDGSTEPVIEANAAELVGGGFLTSAPFSEVRARGRNLYLPIPYKNGCKVTVDNMIEQGNLYYQINYRSYSRGTQVESFSTETLQAQAKKIQETGKTLLSAGNQLAERPTGTPETSMLIPADAVARSLAGKVSVPGGAALQQIVLSIDVPKEQIPQALRSTLLTIVFDDIETVQVPLGDFFGAGIGINPYKSYFARMEEDGTMISLWKMPFQRSMEVFLTNFGPKDVTVKIISIWAGPYHWDERSMYFHAHWKQQRDIETVAGDGTMDWNYTHLAGRGVFVGDVLSVQNYNPSWWGEGDEKIYIDNETFPSHFGTGTEDYYGYAWCTPQFFDSPFHFQPRAEGPDNFGHATNGRFRLLDTIPFTKEFRFDMEIWHWAQARIDYSCVCYWYGRPETRLKTPQDRSSFVAELQSPVRYHTPISPDIPGFVIEKAPTGGRIQVQNMTPFGPGLWQHDNQLWWTQGKPGDRLELVFQIDREGDYRLSAALTKARDYAITQFYIDEFEIGPSIDLYNQEVIPTGLLELGSIRLRPGPHILTVEIRGKNEKADSGFMIGIDQLVLTPK